MPWAEDQWAKLRIVPSYQEGLEPQRQGFALRKHFLASRCMVVQVDDTTGKPDPSGEPLITLDGFRKHDAPRFAAPDPRFGDEPMFGLKLSLALEDQTEGDTADTEGCKYCIAVGDTVALVQSDDRCCASAPIRDNTTEFRLFLMLAVTVAVLLSAVFVGQVLQYRAARRA